MGVSGKEELKNKILADIESIKKSIESLKEAVQPIAPDVSLGRLTRMEAIASKGVNEATLRDSETRLADLEKALEKLDGSNYGLCSVCGEAIAPARLEFMPECTTCVKCAS